MQISYVPRIGWGMSVVGSFWVGCSFLDLFGSLYAQDWLGYERGWIFFGWVVAFWNFLDRYMPRIGWIIFDVGCRLDVVWGMSVTQSVGD